VPAFVNLQLTRSAIGRKIKNPKSIGLAELQRRLKSLDIETTTRVENLLLSVNRINPAAAVPIAKLPEEIRASLNALKAERHQFHGAKISLAWFPYPLVFSPCSDKFGYISPASIRNATRLPFNATTRGLMDQLGALMGDPGRDTGPDSTIPAPW
jgi:hypothetical protein